VILETERLILTTWLPSDWTALRPIASDAEVMRYITNGVAWSDEKICEYVERQIKVYHERGFCRWKLIEKSTGEVIGFCGIGFWSDAPDPEIGWWLARSHWGRGLATEAARVALHDAFHRVGLERIISVAMPANTASTRIMEKLGLKFDCEFQGEGTPLVRYAITRTAARR
jgi:RimJ/RimL family protein N-acetyltransferase